MGVNLAGVTIIMDLLRKLRAAQAETSALLAAMPQAPGPPRDPVSR